MKSIIELAVLSLLLFSTSTLYADTFGSGSSQFTIDFVTIGNPGNAADPSDGPTDYDQPEGSVPYSYRMGKYEISRDMVSKANIAGDLGIAMEPMAFVPSGPRPEMPATGISWNEAARFVNWLNISEGSSVAYKFSTQPGDVGYNANEDIELWASGDPGFNASNPFRNSLARYFLPGRDEWYKSAYYDPNSSAYWNFPNASDGVPTPVANGTVAGTAVWNQTFEQGPADIKLAGGLSPYGVMGLAGNAYEWGESGFAHVVNDNGSVIRPLFGGSWDVSISQPLSQSGYRSNGFDPRNEGAVLGFRVASAVPEPSSLVLVGMAILALIRRGHSRRLIC